MATKAPQLKPEQQHVLVEYAEQGDGDPQALLDSLVDHFRTGPEYEQYRLRIEQARRSIAEGKGIPHGQVMQELRDHLDKKMSAKT